MVGLVVEGHICISAMKLPSIDQPSSRLSTTRISCRPPIYLQCLHCRPVPKTFLSHFRYIHLITSTMLPSFPSWKERALSTYLMHVWNSSGSVIPSISVCVLVTFYAYYYSMSGEKIIPRWHLLAPSCTPSFQHTRRWFFIDPTGLVMPRDRPVGSLAAYIPLVYWES